MSFFLNRVLGTVGQFKTNPGSMSNAIRNNAKVFYIFRSVLYQRSLDNCYKDKGTVKLNNFNIFVLNYKLEIFELFFLVKAKFHEFMYRIISSGLQNYCINFNFPQSASVSSQKGH